MNLREICISIRSAVVLNSKFWYPHMIITYCSQTTNKNKNLDLMDNKLEMIFLIFIFILVCCENEPNLLIIPWLTSSHKNSRGKILLQYFCNDSSLFFWRLFLPGTKETFIYKPVVIRPAARRLQLNTKLTNQSEPREAGLFEASQKR